MTYLAMQLVLDFTQTVHAWNIHMYYNPGQVMPYNKHVTHIRQIGKGILLLPLLSWFCDFFREPRWNQMPHDAVVKAVLHHTLWNEKMILNDISVDIYQCKNVIFSWLVVWRSKQGCATFKGRIGLKTVIWFRHQTKWNENNMIVDYN